MLRGEVGAELVEFSICCFVLCMFVFGVIELCLVLFSFNTAAEAARDTARWLSIQGAGSCTAGDATCVPASTAITAHVQDFPGAAQMTPTVNWCSVSGSITSCSTTATNANTAAGSLVQVQVHHTYASVPFIAPNGLTASSTSQMVIWQ